MSKKEITLLCPVYNEEDNVEIFYQAFSTLIATIEKYSFKFLFLDNCSTDSTFAKLRQLADLDSRITVLRYSKNFGVMKSIYTGLLHVKTDCVAVFDCDLQDPPTLLLEFISKWEEGGYIVYGKRMKRDEPRYLTILRNIFKFIQRKLDNSIEIESGAWLIDQRVLTELRNNNSFEPYLPGLLSRIGFKTIGVPYEREKRKYGQSKFNTRRYFSYATDGIVSGTILPLRLSIWIGVTTSILSVILMAYFILAKFYWGFPFASGIAANITMDLFFWGIHFIVMGILGEYIGRIYLKDDSRKPAIIERIYSKDQNEIL